MDRRGGKISRFTRNDICCYGTYETLYLSGKLTKRGISLSLWPGRNAHSVSLVMIGDAVVLSFGEVGTCERLEEFMS